jgi:hypothetical protein
MIERLNELGRRHQGKVQSLYDLINVMIERTPEPKR